MPDIGPVLRDYLKTIARERVRLDQMETGIKALLELEEHRDFPVSNNGNGNGTGVTENGGGTQLSRFLFALLKNSKNGLTVDEIKASAHASKFDFGNKAPGRVIHWGLVGMGDAVEKMPDGKWRLKEVTQ